MDEEKNIPHEYPDRSMPGSAAAPTADANADKDKEAEMADATEPLKGRAALLDSYKKANEGAEGEPDEDTLAEYALSALKERDSYKGRYETFQQSNQRLIDAVRSNPAVAEFIARIGRGEDPMKAIGQSFGDLRDMIDDESIRKIDEGAAERKSSYEQVRANFESYSHTLNEYAKAHGLTEEEKDDVHNAIIGFAQDLSTGKIDEGTIDFFHKALTYDEEKTADINAATLAGRNAAIDDIKNRQEAKADAMPDVTADRAMPRSEESYYYEPRRGNISDLVKDKE